MVAHEIVLRHGLQANVDIGSVAVAYADKGAEGEPPNVLVIVGADDGEHEFTLHPGDTFAVSRQTWKLDRVESPGGHDWTVVLTRVS